MSSRRTSASSSTWSQQWTEAFEAEASDVSTQAGLGALFAKHEPKKPYYWLKVVGIIFLIIFLLAGAFIGGYMIRRAVVEKWINPKGSSSQSGLSWREGSCQIFNQSSVTTECSAQDRPTLLVICLSGFRPDFITKDITPALFRLQTCGVHAPYLQPVFPTNTFPNQYSIATGLYPANHGIVDDVFVDGEREGKPIFDGRRSPAQILNDPVWWKGEAIWQTAKKAGKRVFTYHWAGSEVTGKRPDESRLAVPNLPIKDQFSTISNWTSLSKAQKPDIILAFIDQPDTIGHRGSVTGPEFIQGLRDIDASFDQLMQKLHTGRLLSCTDVMVISDHGTEDSTCSTGAVDVGAVLTRNIREYFGQVDFSTSDTGGGTAGNKIQLMGYAGGNIRLSSSTSFPASQPNSLQSYMVSHALSCENPDNPTSSTVYSLYNSSNIPRRLHYSHATRIEPLILTSKPGHSVWKATAQATCAGTVHGSDNLHPNMQAVFLATGPSFRTAVQIRPFSTVRLYNLMCELTGLTPSENDGTPGAFYSALARPKKPANSNGPQQPIPQRPGFPATKEEIEAIYEAQNRRCQDACGKVLDTDLRLNISDTLAEKLTAAAGLVYYGFPVNSVRVQVALLVQHGFITGYSFISGFSTPIWSALTLRRQISVPMSSVSARDNCTRNDVRLSTGTGLTCKDYEYRQTVDSMPVEMAYLVPPVLTGDATDQTDAKMITNVVPMYPSFRNQIWTPLWDGISRLPDLGERTVIVGPIFDHMFPHGVPDDLETLAYVPGLPKVPLPSHFYLIAIRQQENNQPTPAPPNDLPTSGLDVLSFILPHNPSPNQHPCHKSVNDYLLTHSATIQDIEQITGIKFLSNFSPYEAIRLKTTQPNKLWW